jgi:hypothetical protein
MFRQNNAILRERLCSFLSHFRVNIVGEKSNTGHMTERTYRANWEGTLPTAYSSVHLVG